MAIGIHLAEPVPAAVPDFASRQYAHPPETAPEPGRRRTAPSAKRCLGSREPRRRAFQVSTEGSRHESFLMPPNPSSAKIVSSLRIEGNQPRSAETQDFFLRLGLCSHGRPSGSVPIVLPSLLTAGVGPGSGLGTRFRSVNVSSSRKYPKKSSAIRGMPKRKTSGPSLK
jgi:hypothetical protein